MDILRLLPADEYNAAVNANAPTALNPFATIADLAGLGGGFSDVIQNSGAVVNPVNRTGLNFIEGSSMNITIVDNPGQDRVDITMDFQGNWADVLLNGPNSGLSDPILDVSPGVPREMRSNSPVGVRAGLQYFHSADTGSTIDAFFLYSGATGSKATPNLYIYGDGNGLDLNWKSGNGGLFIDDSGTYLYSGIGPVYLNTTQSGTILVTDDNSNEHTLDFSAKTDNRAYTFQNASGTLAFLTDIPAGAGDNIYNTDGTLTASRTVTMNALALTLDGTGGDFIFSGSSGNASVSNLFTAQVYNASIGSGNGYRFNGFIDHKMYMTGTGNMFFEVDGNDLVRLQNSGGFRGVSINTGGAVPTATLDVQGIDDLATSQILRVRNLSGGEIIRTFADGEIQIGQGGTSSLGSVGIRSNPNAGELAVLKVNQGGLSSARQAITAIAGTGATAIRALANNGPAMYLRKGGTADFDSTLIVNRLTGNTNSRWGSIELRSNTQGDSTSDQPMAEVSWKGTNGDTAGNQNGILDLRHSVAGVMGTGVRLSGSSLKAISGYDFETLGSSNGLVVFDRTNGNRYRIYTDGGVVNTELVP